MEQNENYRQRHLAQELIETEGWTKDTPESLESRMIFSDRISDKTMITALRATYPVLV